MNANKDKTELLFHKKYVRPQIKDNSTLQEIQETVGLRENKNFITSIYKYILGHFV